MTHTRWFYQGIGLVLVKFPWGKVEKKGYKEATIGRGAKRSVGHDDFENSLKMLKSCGWEFELNTKQQAKLEDGQLPKQVVEIANKAFVVH